MINHKKVLAVIPARGGSKGIPRKNIRMLAGKPLIAWTINAAKRSRYIDRLIISSEDAEIIEVARRYECEAPFVRPAELAQDATPGIDPILHAVKEVPGYDCVLLLQPTSPLRTGKDIDDCIEFFMREQAETCVAVTEVGENPYWMHTLTKEGRMRQLIGESELVACRQDLPKVFIPNGALYIANVPYLMKHGSFFTPDTAAYVMARSVSLDLDTEYDFMLAENILCGVKDTEASGNETGKK